MKTTRLLLVSFSLWLFGCSGDPADGTTSTSGSTASWSSTTSGNTASTSGASSASATSGTGMVQPMPPTYDWTHIIGTGQSLSIGAAAGGLVSTKQPFGNLKLVDNGPDPKYPVDDTDGAMYEAVSLIEPIRERASGSGPGYDDGQYPNNLSGETPHGGMANQISFMWKGRASSLGDFVSTHSVVGWSGHKLLDIDKAGGKRAYPASLVEAKAFKTLAAAEGKSFGTSAVIVTHGESDAGNSNYGAGLLTLSNDYNQDLKQITGQAEDVVMLVSQQSTLGGPGGSAVQVFDIAAANPGRIVCVGPKYAYEYASDKIHLKKGGYVRLGQKYGEVFDKIKNQGIDWKPVGPRSLNRSGKTISIAFDVPSPPLVWETNILAPHQTAHQAWKAGRGFEVARANGTELAIASVDLQGDTVTIELVSDPGASPIEVRYAIVQDMDGLQGGTEFARRGQLRDSNEVAVYDDETIQVQVKAGSAEITSDAPSGFRSRTGFDLASGSDLPMGTIVRSVKSDNTIVLSAPWGGASGTVPISFRRDMYNYAVHFTAIVN